MGILVIQNDPIVPAGQLSAFLGGHEVVRAWEDPARIRELSRAPLPGALVLLGGRANCYDDAGCPWLEDERKLMRRCVGAGVRVLGICLGAQLIAQAFGGRVSVGDMAGPEYGALPLMWGTNDQAGGGGAVPLRMALASTHVVFADHEDAIVALPPGAREWARSDKYTQIFSFGTALGVQFHPEVTREIAIVWASNNDVVDTEDIVAGYDAHEGELASTCKTLVEWVSGVF